MVRKHSGANLELSKSDPRQYDGNCDDQNHPEWDSVQRSLSEALFCWSIIIHQQKYLVVRSA